MQVGAAAHVPPLSATTEEIVMKYRLPLLLTLMCSSAIAAPVTPGGRYLQEMARLADAPAAAGKRSAAPKYSATKTLSEFSADIPAGNAELLRQFVALDTEIRKWRKTEPVYAQRWKTLEAQTFNRQALILPEDRDPADVVLRRTAALLEDLRTRLAVKQLGGEASALAALAGRAASTAVSDFDARWNLYVDACTLRRKITMRNPLLNFDRILLCTHRPGPNHICDQYFGMGQSRGGAVYVLENAMSASPRLVDLLAGKVVQSGRYKGKPLDGGSFMSLDLDYDAGTIAFAWTACGAGKATQRGKWDADTSWHVFTADADGNNIRQLTDGTWNDFDPCFLPNGRIAFISERRGGFGRCHPRPVPSYTLHGMMADGSDIIPLSSHETNEWNPSVNNDGMIVYTRWDYVDRDPVIAHHIWLTCPDGRDPRSFGGNYPSNRAWRPDAEMAARAIPGSNKYVAVAAPHHGQSYGPLIIIDQSVEDDNEMSQIRRITPEFAFPEVESQSNWSPKRPMPGEDNDRRSAYGCATPWPLDENYYLAAYDPMASNWGVYVVDAFGNRELLCRGPSGPCLDPIPLRSRTRPPVIPIQTTQAKAEQLTGASPQATVALMNVYNSDFTWPAGRKAAALRIIQIFPKTTPNADEPSIGPSQSLARGVLGTVPVEPDGSAYFKAPVGVPVYFQALDANGMAIQSMRSATYVHPGETLTCQGCHEPKNQPKPNFGSPPLALRRAPSAIAADVDGSWPLSFPRLVQPVLDSKCVTCHQKVKNCPLDGAVNGQQSPSHAYSSLVRYTNWCGGKQGTFNKAFTVGGGGRCIPEQFGAKASKLFTTVLDKDHYQVKLTAEERHRIALWIDGNVNFYGAYENTEAQCKGQLVKPSLE